MKKETPKRGTAGIRPAPPLALVQWTCESCGGELEMPAGGDIVRMHEHGKKCNGTLMRVPVEEREGNEAFDPEARKNLGA